MGVGGCIQHYIYSLLYRVLNQQHPLQFLQGNGNMKTSLHAIIEDAFYRRRNATFKKEHVKVVLCKHTV